MKTLYLDCGMGAAGDMLAAALIELLPDPDKFMEELTALPIPGVQITAGHTTKCGIRGTSFSVKIHGREEDEPVPERPHGHCGKEHPHSELHLHGEPHPHRHFHRRMEDIQRMICGFPLSVKIKDDIMAVYQCIAEAESHAHGVPVTEVHFHEVGMMDAVADITAVCMLMDRLAPDEIIVSPVHVGSGHVHCAHGTLPVPAPATAYILKDVPVYGGSIQGELCTPTGAALLRHFAVRFGDMPVMKIKALGYGMGKRNFDTANCVRAMIGETSEETDMVLELSCNVDDMNAEDIGFAMERLFEGGALDVFTIPIGMKKSRPGVLIRVLCRISDRDNMVALLFRHTTTIGIREAKLNRYLLARHTDTIQTPYGEIQRKISSGYSVRHTKYEYEDLARIATEQRLSLEEVRRMAWKTGSDL